MISRDIEIPIVKYVKEYPIIAIVGPRQSGKTTLARYLFPKYKYLSMENLDLRKLATDDPRGFLDDHGNKIILDEIQRVPELFSYLQERVDLNDSAGQYILTGSQQFLLMEKISQSLAGRIANFRLFPFSVNELFQKNLPDIATVFKFGEKDNSALPNIDIYSLIHTGMYPRIHDKKLSPYKWLENYLLTYVERDIRNLVNVENLRTFENFLKTIAAYSGQLVNYASISSSVGISEPTVKKWISLLETSGIVFMLAPYYKNFSKRIIKSPKLYFIDTGLLCFLLSIRTITELKNHPLRGNIFETFIIGDLYKRISHTGEIPPLYFWRDKTGNEIDLVIDLGKELVPVEIKSSKTYLKDFETQIYKWMKLCGNLCRRGFVLYDGKYAYGAKSPVKGIPWRMM